MKYCFATHIFQCSRRGSMTTPKSCRNPRVCLCGQLFMLPLLPPIKPVKLWTESFYFGHGALHLAHMPLSPAVRGSRAACSTSFVRWCSPLCARRRLSACSSQRSRRPHNAPFGRPRRRTAASGWKRNARASASAPCVGNHHNYNSSVAVEASISSRQSDFTYDN